ncbi:DUF1600 domain-containing protein [Mycoplasma bradburyae]|uniref:DUF1600 domain-containing protein n=1 Tax=Mycoplasma bradburyae TaxID=2963128 RepID=A0AAW6HRV6_9MOLU|nr:DUF1600 domain-containing protein [Mycoplasma bradburyae]MDC4183085.1 DUF1600 domain-containing protein [Mycoplasma bradburyae]UTS70679.1 DUF1600 domain-containing protein [Mycoplasma bradburyae]
MNTLDTETKSFDYWFKYKLDRTQKIFFFVFLLNLITFGFIVQRIIDSLQTNEISKNMMMVENFKNGYTVIDKFTNQSNTLLLIFSFFYVFFPKHSFLKNDKFLIACIVYILFTFVGYNLILNALHDGYEGIKIPINFARGIFVHLINPIVFVVCGFVKFVYAPSNGIKKFWSYLIPGMIYPLIYGIYIATIPHVYNTKDNNTYSVYGSATDVINNPKIAWTVIISMLFVYFPTTYFIVWWSHLKISKKYINFPAKLRKRSIKYIKFKISA